MLRMLAAATLILIAGAVNAATVEFDLSWSAPTDGGPLWSDWYPEDWAAERQADYRVSCTDASGATLLNTETNETSVFGTASGVAEGEGRCEFVARGPGGESDPAVAAFSIGITLPPGPPTDFTLQCSGSIEDGTVTCEQV